MLMLIMNYTYRIYPTESQEQDLLEWLEISRKVYNYALGEIKDWINSRKCMIDRCSLRKEYIIPADAPFPSYHRQQNALPKAKKLFPELGKVHSQVLQCTIRRLHDTWENFQQRGFGFPRFRNLDKCALYCFHNSKMGILLMGKSNCLRLVMSKSTCIDLFPMGSRSSRLEFCAVQIVGM